MDTVIRAVKKEDIDSLKAVLDSIELFPSEYLEDMISDYFQNPASQDIWLTSVIDNKPIAIAYCAPEKFAEGTFNLYAIGVSSKIQSKGIGKEIMIHLESILKQDGHRVLIVETSGTSEFKRTRKFYENLSYSKEAVIRDFWSEGDDKVVYWKKL